MVDEQEEKREARRREFKAFARRTPPSTTALSDRALRVEEVHAENFGLQTQLGPIYDIIRHPNTRMPMSIAIFGDWGSGKTTGMRWIEGLVREVDPNEKKIVRLWFDPWKYSSKEDAWKGLIAEVILKSINVSDMTKDTLTAALKQFGGFLGYSFIEALSSVSYKNNFGLTVKFDAARNIARRFSEINHPEKGYLNEFENTFKKWVKARLGDGRRLVLFIDDLDRCSAEVTLEVLEALKLYLNVDNLVFVVGVDDGVVNRLVRKHYEQLGLLDGAAGSADPDGEKKVTQYLEKMFDVEVRLRPTEGQMQDFVDELLADSGLGAKVDNPQILSMFREIILSHAGHSPREAKRLINRALVYGAGLELLETPDAE